MGIIISINPVTNYYQELQMKMSICIPTHHGRAFFLAELIESIQRQIDAEIQDDIEICISDNASTDGTDLLIANIRKVSSVPIKYFRFPSNMGGVRNFVNVIKMAEADYCWLVGSDDIVIDNSLVRILQILRENPSIGGLTVNKLNFNSDLEVCIGPDPEIILPIDSIKSHLFDSFDEIMLNLGFLFTYMSAHIFRRDEWNALIDLHGLDYIISFRHFPHTFLISSIAKKYKTWIWMADYCVIQRLDNFCLMQERDNRRDVYASEVTEDIVKVLSALLNKTSRAYLKLTKHLFVIYWNPLSVLRYKSYPNVSREDDKAMLTRCNKWFGNIPLFLFTSYPILVIPSFFIRPKFLINSIFDTLTSQTKGLQYSLRSFLRFINLESEFTKRFDQAQMVAEKYNDYRKRKNINL
jgi:abequosyltransferase